MKRPIALISGAICALSVTVASAQTGVTVTVPTEPPGAIQATVNGIGCGPAGAVSATGAGTLTLPATCATPGAVIGFTSGGVALGSTVTVPATGARIARR